MKKLFTLFIVMLFASMTFAQVVNPMHSVKHGPTITKQVNLKSLTPHSYSKGTTRWFNYGEAIDSLLGGVATIYGNILFPDTTIIVAYSGGVYAGPWIHNLGDVLDAHDMDFNDPSLFPGSLAITNSSTYNIDSIGLYGIYERHSADSIVDTLEIEVAVNNTLPKYYFVGSAINTNLSVDTVWIQGLSYAYATNTLGLTGKKTYKFPLTKQFYADSLDNGLHYIEISTADLPTVAANKYVVSSVKFVPGYSWIPNVDSLDDFNAFHFLSFLENSGSWPAYTKRDFNISYIIPQDVRYNVAGTWNGLFVPSFAYMGGTGTDDYPYEHHLIYYLVDCQTNCGYLSVNDYSQNNQFQLGEAFPNPANTASEFVIPFNLTSACDQMEIVIYNQLGQVIQSKEYTSVSQGEHQVKINTSDLNSGLYFYSLTANGDRLTKKLFVQ
jgi:hypothetical protein